MSSSKKETVSATERLLASHQMLERASRESLSVLQEYVLQKAIGLFLLGERNSWGIIHARTGIDGQSDLSPKPRLTDDGNDEVVIALAGLEEKKLLHFEPEDTSEGADILCYIAATRDGVDVLLRNEHSR